MTGVLIDSNVLLDVMTEDPQWFDWSSEALVRCADDSALVINPVVYAEVSIRFKTIEELEDALPKGVFGTSRYSLGSGISGGKMLREVSSRGRNEDCALA